MKFVCLGYIEESVWDNLPEDERQPLMEACFDYDDELRRGGHFLGGEALDTARHAVTLRPKNGTVDVSDGPYAETKEMLGGILLLEARDMNHAIALMSQHPGVKSGPFEIRPAAEEINAQIAARDAAVTGENQPNATVQPYLFFSGRCEEALEFYRSAVGAQVEMLMYYKDSPDPPPPGTLQPGFENKVMHATFRIGKTTLMASDGCDDRIERSGFSLAISVPTEAEADRVFAALGQDGQIQMPLAKTFWSPRFGMLTDRFGVGWMVTVAAQPTDVAALKTNPVLENLT